MGLTRAMLSERDKRACLHMLSAIIDWSSLPHVTGCKTYEYRVLQLLNLWYSIDVQNQDGHQC